MGRTKHDTINQDLLYKLLANKCSSGPNIKTPSTPAYGNLEAPDICQEERSEVEEDKETEEIVCWQTFFVVAPFYCAYAALFGLQHHVKTRLGIKDNNSEPSVEFGLAISLQYVFNLMFRFLHAIVFSRCSSRHRVFIAMSLMAVAQLLLAGPVMWLNCFGLHGVMLAYSLGGVAIGTFEPNFLSSITPLGNETKRRAILGIPVGVSSLLIGGFFLMGPPLLFSAEAIFCIAALGLIAGMGVMAKVVPDAGTPYAEAEGLRSLVSDARQYRLWWPYIWSRALVYMVDMCVLASFSPGVWLYIYDKATMELYPGVVIATDSFFAIFNTLNMLGGLTGRWLSYHIKPWHPVRYLCFTALGVSLMLLRTPLVAPLSIYLVMLGDGLIYGTIIKHIDEQVPREFNLVSISYWCVNGDVGAIIGTNLIRIIRDVIVGHRVLV